MSNLQNGWISVEDVSMEKNRYCWIRGHDMDINGSESLHWIGEIAMIHDGMLVRFSVNEVLAPILLGIEISDSELKFPYTRASRMTTEDALLEAK